MTGAKLHHRTTDVLFPGGAPHGAFPANLGLAEAELLIRLTGQGIAVLREGESCHWVSPQGTELGALGTGADCAAIDRLAALLPNGELVAPVSEEQARNLYHSEVLGHTVWNIQHVFECARDGLRVDLLNDVLARLAEEQDILRTRFLPLGSGWVQAVATPQSGQPLPTIETIEMTDLPAFRRFVGARRAERIAVDRSPLVRGWAARIADRWYLGFVTHHALADAYTLPLLFDQLMAAYAARAEGKDIELPSVREQYWQYALREVRRAEDALVHGRDAVTGWFAGASGPMRLPYRTDASSVNPNISDSLAVTFEPDTTAKLAAFHRAHGITHTQVLTAALALLLRELGNSVPVLRMLQGHRDRASLLNTLGEFTSVALTPYPVPADGSVRDLLRATKARSLDALRHRLPMYDALALACGEDLGRDETWHRFWAADGEVVVDSVDLGGGAAASGADRHGRSLFADSLVTLEESGVGAEGQAVATLFFQFLKADDRLVAVCSWRRALLSRGDAETLCHLLQALAAAMIERPGAPLATLLAPLAPALAGLRDRCGPPPVTVPVETGTARAPFFVECQLLNRTGNGGGDGGIARPLFLVHGAFGDASVFLPLARKLDRPVYGLQARGLFDLQTPLGGVEEIAGFYSAIVEEIQPDGPVDLGGYSIGGSFAYEMMRRLQAAGREVASLTLIDALYPSEHARIADGLYDQVHFVAMGLIAVTRQRSGGENGDALPPRPPRETGERAALIDAFIEFCRAVGVDKPAAWLRGYIGRMVDIQTGYGIDAYRPAPLVTQPGTARYFRNHGGLFYGTRAAYMNSATRDPLDGVDYASAWHDLLPGLKETPVEVDNHIEMLADPALQDMLAQHFATPASPRGDATGNEAAPVPPAPGYALPRTEQYLARLIAEVSGIPAGRIGAADSLERLGMDSLMATEVTQRLQAELGEPVSITLFYECATLRDLAAQLFAEYPRALSQRTGDAASAAADGPGSAKAHTFSPAAPRAARSGDARDNDIAVVGLSGRYPNAPDLDAYWQVLRDGIDCITEVPKDRWDWRDYYSDDRTKPGAHYSKWGGFLDDVDKFDSLFFAMSPREAEIVDPQERLFLEASWAALEDAGYRRADLRGADGAPASVSVYAGVMYSEYQFYGVEESQRGRRRALGGSYAGVANRVSYALDLHGLSLSVDTACSSSLTAIHMACRDLREGVSDVAIAGGVNLTLHPNKYLLLSSSQFISGKGRCESFGEGGEGFIPSEGVGAVILKRLSDAERDGDHIYGVIRGSAVNHGGRTSGYTVPNPVAQERVVRAALDNAGVDPRAVSYVEAHGTGTKIGDPIEIAGLTRAFGLPGEGGSAHRCRIGSAKSNLGHCEAAAGIAGLTKVLLQLREGQIAPSLHADTLNPHIDFERTPFVVNRELCAWERPEVDGVTCARIAGISSFGAGGSNAHLVVEEYRPPTDMAREDDAAGRALIVLSARTAERLRVVADRLCNWIDGWGEGEMPTLQDVAYTLQVGREALPERLAMAVHSYAELREMLGAFAAGDDVPGALHGRVRDDQALVLPFDDEELQEAVGKWIARGKLDRLLALWVQGFAFDWVRLHAGWPPRRVSLPTYPFARERHWIELSDMEVAPFRAIAATESADDPFGVLTALPEWQEKPVPASSAPDGFHAVIACGPGFVTIPADAANQVHYLASSDPDPAQRLMGIAEQAFGIVREFVEAHGTDQALLQFLVSVADIDGLADALSGLARTVRREYPGIAAQVIALDPADGPALERALAENAAAPGDIDICCADGTRRVLSWHEVTEPDVQDVIPWRDGGVYLLTGGLGGLGLIFAQEIARGTDDSTLVLIGRSPLCAKARDALRAIEEHGARVLYRRADVSRWEEVETLVDELVAEDRAPTGIIHAAGIIRDNFIVRKSAKQFASVLAPKVLGAAHLDRATRDLELDFFALFSSAAGVLGNVGQADYAAANAWLDGFAERRSAMVARGQRHGRSVSLGWPLWRDGGMNVDTATRDVIARTSGMVPMKTKNGVTAFAQAIARGAPRVVVMEGEREKLRRYVLGTPDATVDDPSSAPMSVTPDDLGAATLDRLRALFGDVVKLPAERVDPEERLEAYGIDSVMITQLNQALEDVFGGLSKTLFFEFKRLNELAAHLVDAHPEACAAWCGQSAVAEPRNETATRIMSAPSGRAEISVHMAADADEPIAIVGLSGHYPGAPTLNDFWENLAAGRDSITEVPPERWALDGFYEPDIRKAVAEGKSYGKWGGFLEGFDRFDPFFFNISPREARAMDPQERWLLRAAWEAIEDAGYTRETLAERHGSRVGVFAGITSTGFDLYGPELWRSGATAIPRTSFSSVANRISYLLDLNGPSMAIDTMCSSSLTALHEACEQIRRGACDMAVAGAVNLYAHPASYRNLSANHMLSADGRCKSFGKGGDGFVPGEGVGVVLLKPLSRALADGDIVHAVIRASHVNHGGHTNGYTVPNPVAQGELIRAALDRAGIDARAVSYFEAHGTGTELGDPIEINGMTRAFRTDTDDRGFCAIGSVKSNIGHLEAAAGMAGLTKIVLQMRNRALVPSLHADELNPGIDFATSPFRVQQDLAEWRQPVIEGQNAPRIACLSSFGAGGANAHVVVEEFEDTRGTDEADDGPVPVVVSARTPERLSILAGRLADYLDGPAPARLVDVAFTLATGREALEQRAGFVAASREEAVSKFRALANGAFHGVEHAEVRPHKGEMAALRADDAAMDNVSAQLRAGAFAGPLGLWVKGLPLDWEGVAWTASEMPRRVSLPTYPFAEERYWFDLEIATAPKSQSSQTPERTERDSPVPDGSAVPAQPAWDGLCHVVTWDRAEPVMAKIAPPEGCVIILGGGSPIVDTLVTRLRRVHCGSTVVRLSHSDDRESLVEAVREAGPVSRFYTFADGEVGADTPGAELAFLDVLDALEPLGDGVECFVVAGPGAGGAGLRGLACALAQSDHRFRVRNITLADPDLDDEDWTARLISRIHTEPRAPRGATVRLGRASRSVEAFVPLAWDDDDAMPGIENGGVYLLLGGAGMVGRAVTHKLIAEHQARVIWVGRAPERDAELQEKLADFDAGARPAYVEADTLDAASIARAVEDIAARHGRIDGAFFMGKVFHLEDTLERHDRTAFEATFNIRNRGIRYFHAAVEAAAPGFVCYFSSAQAYSFLPANESVGYAAAVTSADRVVRELAEHSNFPVGTVNWGYWQSSVAETEVGEGLARHFDFISDDDGYRVLDRFVGALRAGALDQVLCAGAGESAARLMNIRDGEAIRLVPRSDAADGLSAFAPENAPQDIVTRQEREDLDRWVSRLLFMKLGQTNRDKVLEKYGPLMEEFAEISNPGLKGDIWPRWHAYVEKLEGPELRAAAALAEACLFALPEVLTGEVGATDVVFPQGSPRLVEALYRDNALSDHFNRELARAAAACVAEAGRPVRILEIGAGTGSTTAMVVDDLVPHMDRIAEYRFTDLGAGFLGQARKRFGEAVPAMTYAQLDIQEPLAAQGIAPGSYDIVIATNVLHATRNIRETLRNAKAALVRGGVLLVNEITEKSVVGTVSFGLLDGWWSHKDAELRIPGSPLLDVRGFAAVMESEGFRHARGLTGLDAELGQEVIASVSDGLVRQTEAAEAGAAPARQEVAPAPKTLNTNADAVDTEAVIREALVAKLEGGADQVARDVAFSDYGVDSILGVGFVEAINDALGIDLNATVLFEYPNIAQLALHIDAEHEIAPATGTTPAPAAPLAVQKDAGRSENSVTAADEAIAVIGYSGRFPAAGDAEAFWDVLMRGTPAFGELPDEFKRPGGYRWGAVLDKRDCFDPLFFNISPREAETMNRHQRLVLEEGWRSLEHAGYDPKGLAETRTGIFVGAEPVGSMGESFTGASDALIASRLSYFLGLRGAALVVNTGCSSSGVALHLACRSLLAGECDVALAGGISVNLDPNVLFSLAETGMLSPSGTCRTFDSHADGTVLSEGVGIALLKPLAAALADGDTIHGVIVASAINQDGASNGITAPSGAAQEELIADLYDEAGIDPRTISYVEAHGTGTALGDPVEANALRRVFGRSTSDKGFCTIGSAKAHVGHTSAASGVIGLIKILLSLRHRTLPPIPGFETLNERIEFAGSPFRVAAQETPWTSESGPLTAALSSFGHSGTNAHFVLREHPVQADGATKMFDHPVVIPVSARTPERLREQARRLGENLRDTPDRGLRDVAFTLRHGREAMEARAAFAVCSVPELADALESFDPDAREETELPGDVRRWIAGEDIDWPALPGGSAPRRIPLPTYPFARDVYPVPSEAAPAVNDKRHPLLHANRSGLGSVRYTARFDGSEFFLAGHTVDGVPVMPGVVYLEMARAAVELAGGGGVRAIEDVVWERPFRIEGEPGELAVDLSARADGAVAFVISSCTPGGVACDHARGVVFSGAAGETPADIRIHPDVPNQPVLPGAPDWADCRRAFEAAGIRHGEAMRAVTALCVGEHGVVARLSLPDTVRRGCEMFVLHPALMDSALQAAMALTLDGAGGAAPGEPSMPFALDRLDVFAALPPNLSCRVWRSDDVGNGKLERLDIELFDDDGKVLARLSGLTSRAAETGTVETASQAIEAAADSCVTHLLAPVWAAVPVPAPLDSPADMRVLVAGGTVEQREAIVALYPDARHLEYRPTVAGRDVELNIAEPFDHLVWIAPPSGGTLAEMADAQAGGVMHLFSLIRAHLRAGRTLDELSWTIVTLGACAITAGETLDPTHAAVHGLAGSMAKEFPHWRVRMLDVARGDVLPVDAIFRAPFDPAGEVLARRDDVWFRQELLPADWPETDAPAYRPDGTYLVIGGAGGLGEAWSRAVIEAHDAQVVWVGRRPLDADIQRKLDALAQSGPAPVYINADAGDPVALARACADIRARFGRIDGVVHSALVLEDRSLAAMEPEAFRAALHPKVDASIALARALTGSLDNAPAGDAPDFVLFFSSLQSFTMAAGQSNYAAGSTFADALADALPAHLACPVKVMNWGYWGSVGIVADDLYRERMARAGLVSIEPEEGMAALAGLLSGPFARLALVKTRAGLELGGPAGAADGRVTVYRAEIPSGIQLLATS